MKQYWIILLGFFLTGFLMIPGNALAHTHTGVHAESPFDASKGKKLLHCKLLKHRHSDLIFCPHSQHKRSTKPQFKADCDKSPTGAPVQVQWSKTLMLYPSTTKVLSTANRYFPATKPFRLLSIYPDPLEKPPQHA